jgi:hypothetical protein
VLKTHGKSIGFSLLLAIALALISATALWAASEGITLQCAYKSPAESSFNYQGTEDSCCYAAEVQLQSSNGVLIYSGGGDSDESTFCCAQELIQVAAEFGESCSCTSGCS